MTTWSVEKMAELGALHADLEGRGDLEPLIATVADDPVYEFHPVGLRMSGSVMLRRYYEQFIEHFLPLRSTVELLGEWVNEAAVVQEYRVDLEVDGSVECHNVIAVLWARGELLGGERVYASEQFIRRMLGDLFDELERI